MRPSKVKTRAMVNQALRYLALENEFTYTAVKDFIENCYMGNWKRREPYIQKYFMQYIESGKIVRVSGTGLAGTFVLGYKPRIGKFHFMDYGDLEDCEDDEDWGGARKSSNIIKVKFNFRFPRRKTRVKPNTDRQRGDTDTSEKTATADSSWDTQNIPQIKQKLELLNTSLSVDPGESATKSPPIKSQSEASAEENGRRHASWTNLDEITTIQISDYEKQSATDELNWSKPLNILATLENLNSNDEVSIYDASKDHETLVTKIEVHDEEKQISPIKTTGTIEVDVSSSSSSQISNADEDNWVNNLELNWPTNHKSELLIWPATKLSNDLSTSEIDPSWLSPLEFQRKILQFPGCETVWPNILQISTNPEELETPWESNELDPSWMLWSKSCNKKPIIDCEEPGPSSWKSCSKSKLEGVQKMETIDEEEIN